MDKDQVIIPDIPISAYEDIGVKLEKIPFWERKRNVDVGYAGFLLTNPEKELMEHNIGIGREFSKIQREVGSWAWKNFKEKASGMNPLLGIIEEIGELSKAILKKDQGIRGTPEKHDRDAVDAIGDIMIYLMNHLNVVHLEIAPIASTMYLGRIDLSTDNFGTIEDVRKQLVVLVARLIPGISDLESKSNGSSVGSLMMYLDVMARTYGKSLIEVVTDTWSIVSKRNWVEDSMVGGGHTHSQ